MAARRAVRSNRRLALVLAACVGLALALVGCYQLEPSYRDKLSRALNPERFEFQCRHARVPCLDTMSTTKRSARCDLLGRALASTMVNINNLVYEAHLQASNGLTSFFFSVSSSPPSCLLRARASY